VSALAEGNSIQTTGYTYRISAKFMDQLPKIKPLFALPDEVHQGK
jgi:hypothetical protein